MTSPLTDYPTHTSHTIITPMLDSMLYTTRNCEGAVHMSESTRVVLFGTNTHGKITRQWPIATFANTEKAKAYVTFLRLADRANDHAAILALDPSVARDTDGKPLPGTKWSLVNSRYNPVATLGDEDESAETEPVAS